MRKLPSDQQHPSDSRRLLALLPERYCCLGQLGGVSRPWPPPGARVATAHAHSETARPCWPAGGTWRRWEPATFSSQPHHLP